MLDLQIPTLVQQGMIVAALQATVNGLAILHCLVIYSSDHEENLLLEATKTKDKVLTKILRK